jgi:2-dehydropantoate 2-reductase
MKILIVGAGAIGSLFGALLSQKNEVVLLGRSPHVDIIQRNGLQISGKTTMHCNITALDSVQKISFVPDVILLTVKSYDTETAIKEVHHLIHNDTIVISLQNGLDNIETIERIAKKSQILAGVTTHGVTFLKPGEIIHTGSGRALLGDLTCTNSQRLVMIVKMFNEAGIVTQASNDIIRELWVKAIINSSINPITAFFQCKNGYLLHNIILEKIVEQVCEESTSVALKEGIQVIATEMIRRTKEVIRETADNYSSMVQSIQQRKKTEIDSINGRLIILGKNHGLKMPLNKILVDLVCSVTNTNILH